MKTPLLLLLSLICYSALFSQDYQQAGRRIFLAEAGATVHAMGQSGLGKVMAVGDITRTDAVDKSSDGFFSFYDDYMPTSFDPKQMNWRYEGSLRAVCADDRDGAWVAGYQLNDRGFQKGILQHLKWSASDKAFYPEVSQKKIFSVEQNETNVVFKALCRLPDDRMVVGGHFEYERKRGGEKIVPKLYLFNQGELDEMEFPELRIGSSASVIRLLPNSAGDEIAVIVEYLTDNGESDDHYKEFLLRIKPGKPHNGLDPKWEVGKEERIHCSGFSVSLTNEVFITGTRLKPAAGTPWVGVGPMRAAAVEEYSVRSGVGNRALGGNVLLEGQLNTVSGTNYDDFSYDPGYTDREEFLYFPEQRTFKEVGISKALGIEQSQPAFYGADYYEDTNFNLWLFGQRTDSRSYNRPEAIQYKPTAATLARSLTNKAINPNLSIVEMTPDFGGVSEGILPVGKRGHLRVALHNSGPTLHYLKALVAVLGEARGIQFLSQQPSQSKPFKGIGENSTVRFSFPMETTEEVNLNTGIRFVIQITKDDTILLEHESAIVTVGDKYAGYDIKMAENFSGKTTKAAPRRSDAKNFKVTTQISSARPIGPADIVVKNKQIALNKGRGNGILVKDPEIIGDRYIYEIEFDVDLDPKLNKITFEVLVANEAPVVSDTIFVNYSDSNLPTLHYIGIAPDYSKKIITEGVRRLKYNKDDVEDVAEELLRSQGGDQMYSHVVTNLLTTAEETTTAKLRSFFALLTNRVNDPDRPDYIGKEDLVVIHFAGHGGLMKKNKYVIIPSDFKKEDSSLILDYENAVLSQLEDLNRRVVVLVDACHNPLSDDAGSGRSIGTKKPDPKLMEKLFELHRGVEGIIAFAAASEGELAYEHDRWKNGLFTEALLEALTGKTGYDEDGTPIHADKIFAGQPDGVLTANELSKYINRRVPGLIKHIDGWEVEQHPKIMINRESDRLPGDFPLFRLSTIK